MEIETRSDDKFIVTGVDVQGKRFKLVYSNGKCALSINLYRGHVWLLRDGKRKCIKSVYN